MDSSKKTSIKLSRKVDLRGVYTEQYFWKLILPLIHTAILAVFFCVCRKKFFKNQCVVSFNSFCNIAEVD